MHKELRYQVKTHAISAMPREKKSCKFSKLLLLFFIKKMQYGINLNARQDQT